MFTLFLRAILLYLAMVLAMRALGKRQLGEFQPYEFALTILLADIISGPIGSVSTPLLYGLLPVAAVFVVQGLLTLGCLKSDKIRAIVSGKPAVVVSRGVINRAELDRLCLSLSDLLEGLRVGGFLDPTEVGTAIVEANGQLSAFAKAEFRPPQTGEMQLSTQYEGLPMILIMDGRIQTNNLQKTGQNETWLNDLLKLRGYEPKGVYLASLDTQGRMTVQTLDNLMLRFHALDKVVW